MFDQLFTNVEFNAKHHTYRIDGRPVQNVSGLIKQLQTPFDADYWANRKAQERGISPDNIKAEWEAKAEHSRQLGIQVHDGIERYLLGLVNPIEDDYMKLSAAPHLAQFALLWDRMKDGNLVIKTEWVIADANLGVAGTADCFLFGQATQKYHLFDWKTNSKFKLNNRFQKLRPPFDDLDDCELNTYSLQQSLYRLIIERAAQINMGESYIVHLTPTSYQLYQALDLRERLVQWLPTVITT